jgi:ParB-like chromosome segregation protein Spo0J
MSVPLEPKQFTAKPNRNIPVRTVSVTKLMPSQNNYDHDKVESMARNPVDKPPLVARHKGHYTVLDGHHRASAAILRGDKTIRVKVVK